MRSGLPKRQKLLKNQVKKVQKLWDDQRKLYGEFLAWQEGEMSPD